MIKKTITLILVIFSIGLNAQTYKYEIISKGKKIGYIEGTIVRENNMTKVDIEAVGKISFILTEHIKYKLSSIYKNDELLFSSATIFLNGKLHFRSDVKKDGEYYIVEKNEHKETFTGTINYSGALLYFIEPEKNKKIYSEIDNIGKNIIKENDNTYKIINPNTQYASFFTYENGILRSANIHHTYIDVEINRIK